MNQSNLYNRFFEIFKILLVDNKSDILKVKSFIEEYWKHIAISKETKIFFNFLHSQYSNNLDIFAMFHVIVNQNDEFRDKALGLLFNMYYNEEGMNYDSLLSAKFLGNDFYIHAIENYDIWHNIDNTGIMSVSPHDQCIPQHHRYLYSTVNNTNYMEIMQVSIYNGFRNCNNCYNDIYINNTAEYNAYNVVAVNDSSIRLGKVNVSTSNDRNIFLLYGMDKFNSIHNLLTLNFLGVPECP